MKKDLDWLRREVKKLEDKANKRNRFGSEYTDEEVALEDVKKLINQLGEPEITEEQAYNKIAETLEQHGDNQVVITKPEIPRYVADHIEKYKKHNSNVWHLMNDVEAGNYAPISIWLWDENNADTLANAWLYGYTVKQEPKYTVCAELMRGELQKIIYLFREADGIINNGINRDLYDKTKEKYQLTEQEIKTYAPDFWPIAERVNE